MLKRIDGGKTIEYVKGISHGDHHDLWIDPADPKRMIVANDGGVDVSRNGGESWYRAAAADLAVLPRVGRQPAARTTSPARCRTSAPRRRRATRSPAASTSPTGTTSAAAKRATSTPIPSDPNIVYAGEYLGIITRYDHRTGESRNVSAWPENPSGMGGEDMKYRFQWTAPIAGSPHDPKVVYHGAQVLFRTRDGGQTWDAISPDLTRNDKSKQKWSGGPITGDNTGVETYGTIFAIAESPKQKGLIWAGSDDGLVHVTSDDGKNWKNVTAAMPGFPEWGTVSMIEPSPFDASTAYVVVDAHRLDDMRPYLCKTTDFGKTWKRLDGELAPNVYLHAVREDPEKRGLLYLGTERGVMFSPDDGQNWQPLQLNLPTVAVHDLRGQGRRPRRRHARAVDLDPRRPAADPRVHDDRSRPTPLHLFAPQDAMRWRYGSNNWGTRGALLQSAARRLDLLLAEGRGEGRAEDRDPRQRGIAWSGR